MSTTNTRELPKADTCSFTCQGPTNCRHDRSKGESKWPRKAAFNSPAIASPSIASGSSVKGSRASVICSDLTTTRRRWSTASRRDTPAASHRIVAPLEPGVTSSQSIDGRAPVAVLGLPTRDATDRSGVGIMPVGRHPVRRVPRRLAPYSAPAAAGDSEPGCGDWAAPLVLMALPWTMYP